MRLRIVVLLLIVGGSLCVWRGVALSQGSGSSIPADCKKKEQVQYLSSGSLVSRDTSKVNCTVDYWICGNHLSKSQVLDNAAGACDGFKNSVVAGLPKEVCCDCYPNCGDAGNQQQKQDCCGDVEQLKEQVKQLENRVKHLEEQLNGDEITLGSGSSNLKISNKQGQEGVSITSGRDITIKAGGKSVSITSSGDISVKAGGNLSLKGARVTQN